MSKKAVMALSCGLGGLAVVVAAIFVYSKSERVNTMINSAIDKAKALAVSSTQSKE